MHRERRANLTIYFVVFISGLAILSACKKDFTKIAGIAWTPSLVFPFVQYGLTLDNVIDPDSNLQVNPDGSLKIVYRQDSVYSIKAEDIFDFPQQEEIVKEFTLSDVRITDFTFGDSLSLNDMLPYMDEELQEYLIVNNGEMMPLPAFLLGPVDFELDPISEFVEIDITEGVLVMGFYNGLPTSIVVMAGSLLNATNDTVVADFSFESVESNTWSYDTIVFGSTSLNNHFNVKIENLFTNKSPDPVLINLDDIVKSEFIAEDVKINGGTAIIDDQVITLDTGYIELELGEEVEMFHFRLQSGLLNYSVESLIPTNLSLGISLTSADLNGQIPSAIIDVPAFGNQNEQWILDGIEMDLSQDVEHPYNKIQAVYEIYLYSSGEMVTFDTNSKLELSILPEDFKLNYIDGYIGQSEIGTGFFDFNLGSEFLDNIISGLELDNPQINIHYRNSMGLTAGVDMTVIGESSNGMTSLLNMDEELFIAAPENPGQTFTGIASVDKSNSNIIDFFSIVPSYFQVFPNVVSNPDGYQLNFVTDSSMFVMDVEVDLPIVLNVSELHLMDTIDAKLNANDIQNIKSANFEVNVLNGFPLGASMHVILLDSAFLQPLETINISYINPAIVDENGNVVQAVMTNVSIILNENSVENLKKTGKVVLNVNLNTNGQSTAVISTNNTFQTNIGVKLNPGGGSGEN